MANETATTTTKPERIENDDYSKQPFKATEYADMRGVIDFGNLMQFAPYESGYCFLAVINGPTFCYQDSEFKAGDGTIGGKRRKEYKDLQEAFIKILEQEFKGLSGLENISSDTMEITDNISTLSLISKVNMQSNGQISMQFTEKSGGLITKFLSTYLRFIKDGRSEAKTYGGAITKENAHTYPGFHKEVFNLLYIVTDSTCLNVEKAYLLLNAQPTEAPLGDLYNNTKGDISTKEIDVTFNCFVVDGSLANKLADAYLGVMVKTRLNKSGTINLDSYDMNWSISGITSSGSEGSVLKPSGVDKDGNPTGGINGLQINQEDNDSVGLSGGYNITIMKDDQKNNDNNMTYINMSKYKGVTTNSPFSTEKTTSSGS